MLLEHKTQGILEYTIMIAAVVAIIVVVMLGQGGVGTSVKNGYLSVGQAVNNTTSDLVNSITPAPSCPAGMNCHEVCDASGANCKSVCTCR